MIGARIVIVEDNPLNLELVKDLLESAGFEVYSATKAEEGLALARDRSPDLILMDIALAGMDGLAATRMLKQTPETRRIPVVALTAHAMRGDEQKAIEAGCSGYIVKPIDTRTFVQIVSSHVSAIGVPE